MNLLHVTTRPKLSDALATAALVSVGVVNLAGLAHEVLEVLPRGGRGEVLHHHAVASPGARRLEEEIKCRPGFLNFVKTF